MENDNNRLSLEFKFFLMKQNKDYLDFNFE